MEPTEADTYLSGRLLLYLDDYSAFQLDEINAMSRALEETYTALHVKALRSL